MELPRTMELPKNIVQIGKPDPTHKIIVEDYVISYMKQWNKHGKRDTGIVLYGKKMTEGECRYYFVYGASYIPGVEARMQYLTDDEREEAEEIRAKHFSEYELLGWGELRGELPEGFYMYEQNKGIWIKGYACFFEKNDSMLSFMVAEGTRRVEPQTQVVHKESSSAAYTRENNIDARMEERNRKLEQLRQNQSVQTDKVIAKLPVKEGPVKPWKNAAMIMALVVCVVAGLVLTDEEKRKTLETVVNGVVATATKEAEKLKDSQVEMLQANQGQSAGQTQGTNQDQTTSQGQTVAQGESQSGVLEASQGGAQGAGIAQSDDGTQNAMQTQEGVTTQGEATTGVSSQTAQTSDASQPEIEGQGQMAQGQTQTGETTQEAASAGSNDAETQQEVVARYVSYTIQQGDTLLGICRNQCGSESLLQQVCQLNNIENPDDIKIGQIILLPE